MVIQDVHKLNHCNVNTEVTNRKLSSEWKTTDLICDWILRTMKHSFCVCLRCTSWEHSYILFGVTIYPSVYVVGFLLVVYKHYLFPDQDRKCVLGLRAWSQAWAEFHLERNILLMGIWIPIQRKVNLKKLYTTCQ